MGNQLPDGIYNAGTGSLQPARFFPCNPEKYIMPGAWGGALIGYFSGYFHPSRIPSPNSPLSPHASQNSHHMMKVAVVSSAVGWRIAKRMFVGSILYPMFVCNLQGPNNPKEPGVISCFIAGGMCGAIFGLRAGGPRGVFNGAMTFSFFSGVAEILRRVSSY